MGVNASKFPRVQKHSYAGVYFCSVTFPTMAHALSEEPGYSIASSRARKAPAQQSRREPSMDLIQYIESKQDENLNELKEFLRIPSVSAKSEHKADIENAARWVAEKLRGAGLENIQI